MAFIIGLMFGMFLVAKVDVDRLQQQQARTEKPAVAQSTAPATSSAKPTGAKK